MKNILLAALLLLVTAAADARSEYHLKLTHKSRQATFYVGDHIGIKGRRVHLPIRNSKPVTQRITRITRDSVFVTQTPFLPDNYYDLDAAGRDAAEAMVAVKGITTGMRIRDIRKIQVDKYSDTMDGRDLLLALIISLVVPFLLPFFLVIAVGLLVAAAWNNAFPVKRYRLRRWKPVVE